MLHVSSGATCPSQNKLSHLFGSVCWLIMQTDVTAQTAADQQEQKGPQLFHLATPINILVSTPLLGQLQAVGNNAAEADSPVRDSAEVDQPNKELQQHIPSEVEQPPRLDKIHPAETVAAAGEAARPVQEQSQPADAGGAAGELVPEPEAQAQQHLERSAKGQKPCCGDAATDLVAGLAAKACSQEDRSLVGSDSNTPRLCKLLVVCCEDGIRQTMIPFASSLQHALAILFDNLAQCSAVQCSAVQCSAVLNATGRSQRQISLDPTVSHNKNQSHIARCKLPETLGLSAG